jgi:hypothetical protein
MLALKDIFLEYMKILQKQCEGCEDADWGRY